LNNFWIQDNTQTTENLLSLYIGTNKPTSSFAWINEENYKTSSKIINLIGDNGRLVIEYYSSAFFLVSYDMSNETRTILSTASAVGNSFYVYIKQIGDTYVLGATVLT
jgi:hypothetical protein